MFEDLVIYTPLYVTFFWAILLISSGLKENRARFFLGIFMLFAFMLYFSHAVFFKVKDSSYLIIDPLYILSSLSVYPLYYWYIKLLTVESSIKLYNLRMLIPAALTSFSAAFLYLLMNDQERNIYFEGFLQDLEYSSNENILVTLQIWNFFLTRLIFGIQVIFFLISGRRLVLRYNSRVANFYSKLENRTLRWVSFLLYSFVITSIMSLIFNLIGRSEFLMHPRLLFIPSILFSFLLFFIGFLGYMQNHTVRDLEKDEIVQPTENLKQYNKTQLKENLLSLFREDRIYIRQDLKITQVAEHLKTNRTYVSKLINTEFSCSFSEFVNEYRLMEAKKSLEEDVQRTYSLDYISENAGFGSVNTFIRVFREHEGITPGKFYQGIRK